MTWSESQILAVLDACCDSFTFPMLDNGYVYPAAARLSAYRSPEHWHLAIEVFGFSPSAGIPDTTVYHFGSNIQNRKREGDFVSREAYEQYLRLNPYNELQFVYPIPEGTWIDAEDGETLSSAASEVQIRGSLFSLPAPSEYGDLGIELEVSPQVRVFELCRALAAKHRDMLLAQPDELAQVVPSECGRVLKLDEWCHPDIVNPSKKPSASESFRQIAQVLVTGDGRYYAPTETPNTHWSNWPNGGRL